MNQVRTTSDASNIGFVSNALLCTGCGMCATICPKNAVRLARNPAGYLRACVDETLCVRCGQCLKCCPSFGQTLDNAREDFQLGKPMCVYVGYAADPALRQNGQSGGVVTALIEFMTREGLVDGAIVTSFDKAAQEFKSFYTESIGEMRAASGSAYVQTSVCAAIPKDAHAKYAAVCVGCQAEAFHAAMRAGALARRPEYVVGLVCAGVHSARMATALCLKAGVSHADTIDSFRFRDKQAGGWPGNTHITTGDKE